MERVIFSMKGWTPRTDRRQTTGAGAVSGELKISVDKRLVVRYVPWTGWVLAAIEFRQPAWEVVREYPWMEVGEMKKRTMGVVAVTGPGGDAGVLRDNSVRGLPEPAPATHRGQDR